MKTIFRRHKLLLTALISSLVPLQVSADEYHYRDVLIGDRAAGMAGAYTALSNDATGLYYNPAGIAFTEQTELSASVNGYQHKTTEYSNISKDNPNQTWTRTSSGMVANFFGLVQPFAGGKVGFSIVVPNYDLEDQSDYETNLEASQSLKTDGLEFTRNGDPVTFTANASGAVSNQYTDYNNSDSTTLAGVSYATKLSDDFALGMTLYGYMRKKEMTLLQTNIINGKFSDDTTTTITDNFYQKVQTEEFGLQPRLGISWQPTETLSLGMMAQTTFILSQSPETRNPKSIYTASTGAGSIQTKDEYTDSDFALESLADNDLPFEFNFGAGYQLSESLLLSGDFSYATETDVYESVMNMAVGAEYKINSTWVTRAGFYTNNANTSDNVAVTGDPNVDLNGVALSLSRYSKEFNLTLGINHSRGSGYENLNIGTDHVQDIDVQSTAFFISSTSKF